MFKKATLQEFVECENPYEYFRKYNQIEIDEPYLQQISSLSKVPSGFKEMLEDLKLLNKRDVTQILKFRTKVRQSLDNLQKPKTEPKETKEE